MGRCKTMLAFSERLGYGSVNSNGMVNIAHTSPFKAAGSSCSGEQFCNLHGEQPGMRAQQVRAAGLHVCMG